MKLTQPPTKSQYSKIPSKGQTPEAPLALGRCADMTATFLAFDYRGLYHLVLTKPPNENQTFRPVP